MEIVAEPSCAGPMSGCTTSLPAKTGTTRRELRETWGKPRGAWRGIREPRNAPWFGGNFGPAGGLCGPSGATLEDQGVGFAEARRPGNRNPSGCPGPVVGRTECGSLIAPADQPAGAIGGVSPVRPGEAPASHTCGGLVILILGQARMLSLDRTIVVSNGSRSAGDLGSRRRRRGYPRAHVAWSFVGAAGVWA